MYSERLFIINTNQTKTTGFPRSCLVLFVFVITSQNENSVIRSLSVSFLWTDNTQRETLPKIVSLKKLVNKHVSLLSKAVFRLNCFQTMWFSIYRNVKLFVYTHQNKSILPPIAGEQDTMKSQIKNQYCSDHISFFKSLISSFRIRDKFEGHLEIIM